MNECADFESKIPLKRLTILAELGNEFGFDPLGSVEIEDYFVNLLNEYDGMDSEFAAWVRPQLSCWFVCFGSLPRWIQTANWPVVDSRPMVFVGQIDIPAATSPFHDEASFYLFYDPPTGDTRTIIQVS
ncbi:MAG TPA: hypothetical protein VKX17_23015 [Planctomycetota bacterium]|nr:hypothetical protein [Planctomycetota bacterium]